MISLLLTSSVLGTLALENGLGRVPPLGWSSWLTCGDEGCTHDYCDEDELMTTAQAMRDNGLQALGWDTLLLDDCWAYPRDPNTGELQWDPDRFPSGMPNISQKLHNMGFKFGLYTSAGNTTCNSGGRPFPIPGSEGHYQQDANTFASWGLDYVKLDWCGDVDEFPNLRDGPNYTHEWAEAMNSTGHPMFQESVAGFWFTLKSAGEYMNSWRFCGDHNDDWQKTVANIFCRIDQEALGLYGKPGAWPYMDVITTGGKGCSPYVPGVSGAHCPQQTDDEYRTEFALWSITQSPLLIATDVREVTSIQKEILWNQELLAIHQDVSVPPGKLIGKCGTACDIWSRPLIADNSQVLAALVNLGPKPDYASLNFEIFGWSNTDQAAISDMWTGKSMPLATGSLNILVPTHGTVLLKLTLVKSAAQ